MLYKRDLIFPVISTLRALSRLSSGWWVAAQLVRKSIKFVNLKWPVYVTNGIRLEMFVLCRYCVEGG